MWFEFAQDFCILRKLNPQQGLLQVQLDQITQYHFILLPKENTYYICCL